MMWPRGRILRGDAAEQLRRLPTASIDAVVTSPPYYALRNYQTDGQLGAEANIDLWVNNLRHVMQEIDRLLKPTGGLWLNLGDSYSRGDHYGAPSKSLLLGPERLLLALLDGGWVVRNKIVWAKTNPMPASVGDRLTCTWEPLYFLVRSREYYFDLDAIREPIYSTRRTTSRRDRVTSIPSWAGPLAGTNSGLDGLHANGRSGHILGKNPGDVWRLATSSSRSGHHATFPPGLIRRPVLAGVPERVCRRCGAPWRRNKHHQLGHLAVMGSLRADCRCRANWQPGVVLDPFMGSGTTAIVAEALRRDWVGIELNPAFVRIAEERIAAARGRPEASAA